MAAWQPKKLFESLLRVAERFPGGSAYRGTIFLGYASPLRKLAELSTDIADQIAVVELAYLNFLKHGGGEPATAWAKKEIFALKKMLAIPGTKGAAQANDPLLAAATELHAEARRLHFEAGSPTMARSAHELAMIVQSKAHAALTSEDLARAEELTDGWLRVLNTSPEEMDKALLTASMRRVENARRARARREHLLDLNNVLETVERVMATTAADLNDPAAKALRLFQQTVSPEQFAEIWEIADRLGVFKQWLLRIEQANHMGGLNALDTAGFRALFRPEANSLKGLLLEKWFWCSRVWREQEVLLVKNAEAVARRLGPDYKVIIIRSPLLESGKEIYDGAIVIARAAGEGTEGVLAGLLHTAIQIKAERLTSAIGQINRDLAREGNILEPVNLITRDGAIAVNFLPPPPSLQTNRIIVAPSLPASHLAPESFEPIAPGVARPLRDRGLVQKLEPGVDVLYQTTLLNAEQLDDLAYLLLKSVVSEIGQ